jgi:hypothetical protein
MFNTIIVYKLHGLSSSNLEQRFSNIFAVGTTFISQNSSADHLTLLPFERKFIIFLAYCYMFGIRKRHYYGNAEERCLGSNNSSVVILTGVSTVITKGPLSNNSRIYIRGYTLAKSVLGRSPLKTVEIQPRPETVEL